MTTKLKKNEEERRRRRKNEKKEKRKVVLFWFKIHRQEENLAKMLHCPLVLEALIIASSRHGEDLHLW